MLGLFFLAACVAGSVATPPSHNLTGLSWNVDGHPMITNWTAKDGEVSCSQGPQLDCQNGPPCRTSFGRGCFSNYYTMVQFEMGPLKPTAGRLVGVDWRTNQHTFSLNVNAYLYGVATVCPAGACSNGGSILAEYCPFMAVAVNRTVESNPEIVCVAPNGTLTVYADLGKDYAIELSGPWPTHYYDQMTEAYYVVAHSKNDSIIYQASLDWPGGRSVTATVQKFVVGGEKSKWGNLNINPVVAIAGTEGPQGLVLITAQKAGPVPGGYQRRMGLQVAALSMERGQIGPQSKLTVLGDIPVYQAGIPSIPDIGSFGYAYTTPWPAPTVVIALLFSPTSHNDTSVKADLVQLGPLTAALKVQASWKWPAACKPWYMLLDHSM